MEPSDVRLVTATTPDRQVALELASRLVEGSLAACVQIGGPVRSVYRWEGEVCDDEEWTLTAKTTAARVEQLVELVVELHPYEVPEVIATEVLGGAPSYLSWVGEVTGSSGEGAEPGG